MAFRFLVASWIIFISFLTSTNVYIYFMIGIVAKREIMETRINSSRFLPRVVSCPSYSEIPLWNFRHLAA